MHGIFICLTVLGRLTQTSYTTELNTFSRGLDTKVVFLDHLSILMSGLDGDERRMIDTTMTRLRSLVERTGITLFLVSHLRCGHTDQGHEEGEGYHLDNHEDLPQSHNLVTQLSDLERDQQSGSEHSDTVVRVLKNRYSGEIWNPRRLRYDLSTSQIHRN